jgi:hypothetical protein
MLNRDLLMLQEHLERSRDLLRAKAVETSQNPSGFDQDQM